MAAPARGSTGAYIAEADSSVDVAVPAGTVAGDLLILLGGSRDDVGYNDPAGWTRGRYHMQNASCEAGWWYRWATASEPATYTLARSVASTTPHTAIMLRITGAVGSGHPCGSPALEDVFAAGTGGDYPPADLDPPDAKDRLMLALTFVNNDLIGLGNFTGGTVTVVEWTDNETTLGADATLHTATAEHTAETLFDYGTQAALSSGKIIFSLAILPAAGGGGPTLLAVGGAISPTGALARTTSKRLGGGVTPAGALSRFVSKRMGGSVAPTGLLATALLRLVALGGSISPSGALARTTSKRLAGAVSPAGGLGRRTSMLLGGSVSPAGAIVRRTTKLLAGAITPAGALDTSKTGLLLKVVQLGGSIAPIGELARLSTKRLAGAIAPAGNLAKRVELAFAGAVSPTGSLRKLVEKKLGGAISAIGSLLADLAGPSARPVAADFALSSRPAPVVFVLADVAPRFALEGRVGPVVFELS